MSARREILARLAVFFVIVGALTLGVWVNLDRKDAECRAALGLMRGPPHVVEFVQQNGRTCALAAADRMDELYEGRPSWRRPGQW